MTLKPKNKNLDYKGNESNKEKVLSELRPNDTDLILDNLPRPTREKQLFVK